MPALRVLSRSATTAALFLLLGCASRGASPQGAPAPAAAAPANAMSPLEPPPGALRTADRVQLTGLELGTMWTFENPPLEYWKTRYGFEPTAEWLEHVRLASVRYGEICSASFVSPNGLVMTNHHCARDCVEAVSTDTRDYVIEGFYAATRNDELLCPDLFLDQLVSIEDVTERVQAAAPAGAAERAIAEAQEAEQQEIVQECEAASGLQCQVVSLFHGGQYRLYRYQRYAPVKLVFAPELQAGFFGGDPDNFTYPRYDLDVAFVRAYQSDGKAPLGTPQYFRWDADGAAEEELVFITGNPGGTSRQATVAQLMYERSYRHRFIVRLRQEQRDFLRGVAARGPEAERQVRDQLFNIENSLKAYTGQLAGLNDTLLLGRKLRWEREFRQKVEAYAKLRESYGDIWDRIARIQAEKLTVAPALNLTDPRFFGFAAPHMQLASLLVGLMHARGQPEEQRPQEFSGENLSRVEQILGRPTPLDPETGVQLTEVRLELAREFLPADHPPVREALRPGETPAQAAERLIRGTRVGDVAFRQGLLGAGISALDTTSDPLLRLARVMETEYRRLAARSAELNASEAVQEERLAKALFAVFGTQLPPDATFTLRISDGVVRRYPYNGTVASPFTSFYGLYERANNFKNEMPWTLPRTFAERRSAVNLSVPLNFVATTDITGGNSGSPMIDREGRIVGIAFDGNIEQLPNEFVYMTEAGRSIGVHSAGILEALRNVYQAKSLLDELTGSPSR